MSDRSPEPPSHTTALLMRSFYPHVTGVVTQYVQMGPAVKRYGTSLSVFTPLSEPGLAPHTTHHDIDVRRVSLDLPEDEALPHQIDLALLKAALTHWKRHDSYPDTLVFTGFTRGMLPEILALKRRGIRLLLAMSIYPGAEGPMGRKERLRIALRHRLYLRFFDAITVYSSTFVSLLNSQGIPARKLRVVPFPVDLERFSQASERQALRAQLGLPPSGLLITFVGSVIERKGADLLLEAWLRLEERHPQAHLVFVGPYGPRETHHTEALRAAHEAFLARFEGLRSRLARPNSVIIAGSVDHPETYLQASDIFAFPSKLEGLGGVIPEAMACQLPCILTRFTGFPEYEFGQASQEFVEASPTPESLAEHLEQLLASPSERARLGSNARQQVEKVFDLELVAHRFADACRG